MAEKAILFDATKCIACRACQVACKQWNELTGLSTTNFGSYENPQDLAPATWVKIKFTEVSRDGRPAWLFTRRSCMHCTDAPCVEVCSSGALYHHELGFVAYDKGKCIGCNYCAEFCPFEVPRLQSNTVTGAGKMDKCVLCQDRVSNGQVPACVKTCPTEALLFGDRVELLAEGNKRVADLRTPHSPSFPNATLYGEKEIGGLHVLYVLDDTPERYGLPAKPVVPALTYAWQDVIRPLGVALGVVTVAGLALNYLVARSMIKKEQD